MLAAHRRHDIIVMARSDVNEMTSVMMSDAIERLSKRLDVANLRVKSRWWRPNKRQGEPLGEI